MLSNNLRIKLIFFIKITSYDKILIKLIKFKKF